MDACKKIYNDHEASIKSSQGTINILAKSAPASQIYNAFRPYIDELDKVIQEFLANAHQTCPDEFLGKVKQDVAAGQHTLVLRKVGDKYGFAKINKSAFGNKVGIEWGTMGNLLGGGNYLTQFIEAYDKSLNELKKAMNSNSTILTETIAAPPMTAAPTTFAAPPITVAPTTSAAPIAGTLFYVEPTTAAAPTSRAQSFSGNVNQVVQQSTWQPMLVMKRTGVPNPFSDLKNRGKYLPSELQDMFVNYSLAMAYYKRYFPMTPIAQTISNLVSGYFDVLDSDDATRAQYFRGEIKLLNVFTYPQDGRQAPHGILSVQGNPPVVTETNYIDGINNIGVFINLTKPSINSAIEALRVFKESMARVENWYAKTFEEVKALGANTPKYVQEAWDLLNSKWVQCKTYKEYEKAVVEFQNSVNNRPQQQQLQPQQPQQGGSAQKKSNVPRHRYNGKLYKIHEGPKGGKYIIVDKRKVRITV